MEYAALGLKPRVGFSSFFAKRRKQIMITILLLTPTIATSCSDAGNPRISSSGVFFASLHGESSSQWTAIKNATVSLKSGKSPIFVAIVPALSPAGEGASVQLYAPKSDIYNNWEIDVVRDSTSSIGQFEVGYVGATYAFVQHLPLNFVLVDEPGPGVHTYTVRTKYSGAVIAGYAGALEIVNAKLIAWEP